MQIKPKNLLCIPMLVPITITITTFTTHNIKNSLNGTLRPNQKLTRLQQCMNPSPKHIKPKTLA